MAYVIGTRPKITEYRLRKERIEREERRKKTKELIIPLESIKEEKPLKETKTIKTPLLTTQTQNLPTNLVLQEIERKRKIDQAIRGEGGRISGERVFFVGRLTDEGTVEDVETFESTQQIIPGKGKRKELIIERGEIIPLEETSFVFPKQNNKQKILGKNVSMPEKSPFEKRVEELEKMEYYETKELNFYKTEVKKRTSDFIRFLQPKQTTKQQDTAREVAAGFVSAGAVFLPRMMTDVVSAGRKTVLTGEVVIGKYNKNYGRGYETVSAGKESGRAFVDTFKPVSGAFPTGVRKSFGDFSNPASAGETSFNILTVVGALKGVKGRGRVVETLSDIRLRSSTPVGEPFQFPLKTRLQAFRTPLEPGVARLLEISEPTGFRPLDFKLIDKGVPPEMAFSRTEFQLQLKPKEYDPAVTYRIEQRAQQRALIESEMAKPERVLSQTTLTGDIIFYGETGEVLAIISKTKKSVTPTIGEQTNIKSFSEQTNLNDFALQKEGGKSFIDINKALETFEQPAKKSAVSNILKNLKIKGSKGMAGASFNPAAFDRLGNLLGKAGEFGGNIFGKFDLGGTKGPKQKTYSPLDAPYVPPPETTGPIIIPGATNIFEEKRINNEQPILTIYGDKGLFAIANIVSEEQNIRTRSFQLIRKKSDNVLVERTSLLEKTKVEEIVLTDVMTKTRTRSVIQTINILSQETQTTQETINEPFTRARTRTITKYNPFAEQLTEPTPRRPKIIDFPSIDFQPKQQKQFFDYTKKNNNLKIFARPISDFLSLTITEATTFKKGKTPRRGKYPLEEKSLLSGRSMLFPTVEERKYRKKGLRYKTIFRL